MYELRVKRPVGNSEDRKISWTCYNGGTPLFELERFENPFSFLIGIDPIFKLSRIYNMDLKEGSARVSPTKTISDIQ